MKKSLLILAALGTAPLFAAHQVVVPAAPAASASLHADSCVAGSLALLPQNAEGFVAVGNLPGALSLAGMTPDAVGPVGEIESLAIGFGEGSSDALRRVAPLYTALTLDDSMESIATSWAAAAHGYATDVIAKQWKQQSQDGVDQMLASLASFRFAPLYGVVTVTENGRPLLNEMQQSMLQELQDDPSVEPVEIGPWKGGRLTIPAEEIAEILDDADDLTALQKVKMGESLRKFSLYALCCVQNRSAVFVVCSDPAEIALAATPADSVLSTSKVSFLKPTLNPLMAAYLPAALNNSCQELNMAPLRCLNGFATGVFKTLGAGEVSGPVAPYQKAVEALSVLGAQLEGAAFTKPTTLLLWNDKDVHLDIVADARGTQFIPSAKAVLPVSDKTVFFMDSDATQGGKTIDVPAVMDACEKLAEGVAATLAPEGQQEVQAVMAQYHLFDSEKAMLGSALAAWKEAFTGQVSLVVDAAGTVPASLFGGSPVAEIPVPRVAVNAGVADRSKIGEGSDAFMKAVTQGIEKMGEDTAVLDTVPVSVSQSGAATMHMLALPMCCPGFSPTVAISDKTWSLSSSASLASAWAQAAVQPASAEGKAVFSFAPAPLAGMFSGLAASDLPGVDKQEFAEAAEAAAEISSVISSVSGTMTTPGDGCLHLHVDVKMNKH